MNEKLQKIYDLYRQQGIIKDATLEQFAAATPEQQQALFDLGAERGLFTEAGSDQFKEIFPNQPPTMLENIVTKAKNLFTDEKSDNAVSNTMMGKVGAYEPEVKKKADSTELPSAGSSLASPSSPNAAEQPATTPQKTDNNKSYFSELLGNISKELLDEDEDIVAKRLQEKLRPYGVKVDQARVGREAVSLTIGEGDNAKTIEVPVDNFFGSNDQESADKIKSWLGQNINRSIIDEQEEAHKFNKGFTSKQDFNKSLNEINSSLTTKDEEIVVPRLRNMFEDYGFKFEETGAGDYVEVTAPNGKKKTVPIDRSFNFNMMGGIDIDTKGKGNAEAANEIRSFIDANKPKIDNEVSQYDKYYKRYRNQKEVDEAYKSIAQETTSLISDKKSLAADIVKLRAEEEELRRNPDAERLNSFYQRKQDVINRTIAVQEKEASNKMNEAKLDEAVGKYTRNAENEGTWYGLTANTFTEGVYGIGAGLMNQSAYIQSKANALVNTIDLAVRGDVPLSDAWKISNVLSNAQFNEVTEGVEKGRELLKENVEFEVSEAYKKNAEENFAARNALGIVGFLPAMAASTVNPTAGLASFFASGYDGAMQEMKNSPAFDDVSTDEKAGLATALGFVNAAIMKYSPTTKITNEFLESSFGKSVMQNVLKKMGSETSAKTIQEFTENEVKSAINRGLIKTGENLAHGFGMGVELKVSGDAIKYVYNQAKENTSYSINGQQMSEDDFKSAVSKMSKEDLQSASIETQNPSSSVADMLKSKAKDAGLDGTAMINETQMFQLPTNAADYLYQVAESGLDMAVGSAIMGSVKSLGTAYKENNFKGVSDDVIDNYKLLSIPEFRKAYEEKLQIQVANGEITEAQKNAELNDVDMSIGVLNKVPDNYTAAQKRKAFSLIREREMLDQSIEGKDKSLVKKESERIKQINAELEDVSNQATETPAPAESPAPAAPKAQPAKPKTLDEIQDGEVRDYLLSELKYYEGIIEEDKESAKKAVNRFPFLLRPFAKGVEKIDSYLINRSEVKKIEQIKTNPEKFISDEISKYEKYKEEDGEDFYAQDYLDNLKDLQSKLQEENAIQKPTTEESVLRSKQPEVELPTMGEGNAQETTTQEGVAPAKPEEVKSTEALKDVESTTKALEKLSEGKFKIGEVGTPTALDVDYGDIVWQQSGLSSFNKGSDGKTYITDKDGTIYEILKTKLSINNTFIVKVKDLKGEEVGFFEFKKDKDGKFFAEEAFTSNKGKGIAAIAYDFASKDGEKIKPSKKLKKDGVTFWSKSISEAYHKAKADGSNPELVKAVENLIGKPTEAKPIEQELAELEQMFPETKTGENKGVAASDTKAMDEMHSRAADERVQKVIRTAQKLTKTLKSLFPTADIHLHETEESYNGAMEEINAVKGSNGNFAFGVVDGKPFVRIDINANTASSRDVAHEVAHAVLAKTFGDNQKLFQSFQEKIAKVISTDSNQKLIDFANNPVYREQGVTYEEYMAELKAILSEQGAKIELSTAKKIAAVINEYVSRITKGAFKPFQEITDVKQVVDFVNKVTEAMAKGEAIDVEGAGKMGEGSRSSLRVGNNVEETAERLKEIVSSQGDVKTYYLTDNGLQIGDRDYKFNLMNEIFNKVGARKYALLVRKYIDPTFNKETLAYSNRPFADILKDELHSLSRDYNIDQIKDLAKAADVKIDLPAPSKDNIHISDSYKKDIAKAYHEGNNPSITKAVDVLLGNVISRSSLRTAEQVDKMVKDARASGYSERAIEEFLQKRGVDQSIIDKSLGKKEAGKKIVTNEEMMPGYDKMMEDVNSEILRGLDRKTNETTIEKNVMKIVESSEAYKNATDQQKNEITREVKKAFGEKMKEAPSAEKITGKEDKAATENANKLKDQIKLEAKAAKEGASSVKTAIKKIRDFVVNNKETANLTRKDLLKVIDIMKSVNDEKSLEKATTKVLDIIDKANKDIIEVSKTKMEAQRTKAELKANKEKMKAEIKAAKEGAKGVVNKVKAIKKYFDSVKEYGNLTRRDLLKVMAEISKVKNEETLDKAVDKINDIIDNAKTDVLEISELKMIKQTIKEIKGAKKNIKDKRKLIVDVIENIKKSGKLAASQVNGLLKRANNLNVENFEQVAKFIDYAEKIFTDADYQNKLSKGSALRDSIKNLSKNKSKKYDGNLVKLGEEFNKIDPSLVEDIEQYNKIASELEQAIKGSSMNGFKPTVEIKAVDAYIEEMMTSQKEKLTEIMREQIEELLGVDGSKFTYDEMMELIQESKEEGAEEKQKLSEENEKTVRTTAVKWFESLSSTIEHILKTGKDPFTGEPVDIKESKQKVVRNFMEMDLTKMDIRDAVRAVDALNNFMVNQSTAKMERVFRKYRTERRIEFLLENKITSKVIKVFRSKWFGRGLLREFASETILMDALFGGTGKASIVSDAMGLLGIKSNKSKAQKIVRTMVADYVTEFYKEKANGVEFNTAENNVERGILAFVSRMKIGDEKTSFEDRKSLVEQSIENLREGSEKEQEKAKVYQEVYDKILKDSKSAEEVRKKVDKVNAKAVDFWVEKWAENYEELADVSENIHNVILGRDGYYTPDVVRRVEEYKDKKASEEDVLDMNDSAFLYNSGIIQKKSGRLEKSTIKNKLPEGKYYDFAFDNNNASLMSDALIDVMTAGNVIELSTFLNSPNFKKIVTTSKERELLKERMQLMVRNFRNKGQYSNDEVSQLAKAFNRMNALGASYVLGGLGAIPKQYLVPAINTFIASGGNRPHFDIWWNKSKQKFVNESGESVANRGVMSDADIKNIDNLLNEAAKSTPEKALRFIEAANKIYLKAFLVNRDVAIAKASWLTYYEKGLRNQGFDTKNIDYSDPKLKLNKAAAQYATRMVDRQQNISDEDLRGKMYSRTEGYGPIVTKVLLPFASFRINQWLRMNTDLGIATSKTASKEDRKAAGLSLAATGAEIAMFNAVGLGISAGLHYTATSIKRAITGEGDEEDKEKLKEQDEKYMKNLLKGKGASLVQDFLSPLPTADPLFEGIVYNILDKLQSNKDEDDRINIFEPKPKELEGWLDWASKNSGGAGAIADRINSFKKIANAYRSGKIETTNYGKTTEKNILERDKKALGYLTTLSFLNLIGVLPTEGTTMQNAAFKEIIKSSSTKTEAEIIQEKAYKREKRADNVEKLQIIDQAIGKATDQNVVNELLKMKEETRDKLYPKKKVSDDVKKVLKAKKKREKAEYESLLGGYESKDDLERYNPNLYEQNFGKNSYYYQTHKAEMEARKLIKDSRKNYKDRMYNYQAPPKKNKRKKNKDGSLKKIRFSSFIKS